MCDLVDMLFNSFSDFSINVLVATEVLTPGTPYLAPQAVIDSASNLFEGSSWMIYENQDTGVVNWDPSTLGRSIVYPVSDNRFVAFFPCLVCI